GKINPVGIISMVRKRPSTEPMKEFQSKMGTDNLFQTGFEFSDSLDDNGEISYRLTGLARSTNEQQKSSESQRYEISPS
ncbi:ferrichrome porin FhuA, partial [Salmonella enterica subsp. enterica serovar Infantis]